MNDLWKGLAILALWIIGIFWILMLMLAFGFGALLVLLVLFAVYGWVTYTFLYYRYCRRGELLNLLAGTVEGGLPLTPALRAYLQDRPRGGMREFWIATLLFFVLPGYYWIWHKRNSFDCKVEELAQLLERGAPLFQALQAMPALASRDTVLAAAIGESTGQLARCLRGANQRRTSTLWMELIPQLVYPFAMLLVIATLLSFMGYFIIPKFKRIFDDFGVSLPAATEMLIRQSEFVVRYGYLVVLGIQACVVLAVVLVFSSTARWFFPGLGEVYRRAVRAHVLRMLSLLLETGRAIPESLTLLSGLPLGHMALKLLNRAKAEVEGGHPFAESLLKVGLLPANMLPLVHAAERAGNLPWALGEMAESLYHRTFRVIQRIVQFIFPLIVILLGVLVGLIVIALFMPLVKLITELSG